MGAGSILAIFHYPFPRISNDLCPNLKQQCAIAIQVFCLLFLLFPPTFRISSTIFSIAKIKNLKYI